MDAFRLPILVNNSEKTVDTQLAELCKANGSQLLPKVRIADVLPVKRSDWDSDHYWYALSGHFDFVVVDEDTRAELAIEFDGGGHYTDPDAIARDEKKNRICQRCYFPLLRVGGRDLQPSDHRTLLQWFLEVWFERKQLAQQWKLYYETDGETDKPEVELDSFRYQDYGRVLYEDGSTLVAPLDPFQEARREIGLKMLNVHAGGFEGWIGKDARGHTVGHVALEVRRGEWLMGSGTVNLDQYWVWTSLYPGSVAQDIAMLSLVGRIKEWERGRYAPFFKADVAGAVAGCEKRLLSRVEPPVRLDRVQMLLRNLKCMGVNTEDPRVLIGVYEDVWDPEESRYRRFRDDW